MLKELSEYLNSIKQTQAEMKDMLKEIKNNLQGINSGMDEAENENDHMVHKETKNQPIKTRRKKH